SEMDISKVGKQAMQSLFNDLEEEEIERISELPGVDPAVVALLERSGIEYIEELVTVSDEKLAEIPELTTADIAKLRQIIRDSLEIIDEEPAAEEEIAETDEEGEGTPVLEGDDKESYYREPSSGQYVEYEEEEESLIADLPGIPDGIIEALRSEGIESIIDLISIEDEDLLKIEGISDEDIA